MSGFVEVGKGKPWKKHAMVCVILFALWFARAYPCSILCLLLELPQFVCIVVLASYCMLPLGEGGKKI